MLKNLTIRSKINLSLIAVCIVVLVVSNWQSANTGKDLTEGVVSNEVKTIAGSYFDTINTMMLTGSMANRAIYRKKVLAIPGVVDARIIRGEQVNKLYGPGNEEQTIQDDLDERGMRGEEVLHVEEVDGVRQLTVIKPLIGVSDYNGVNCLACHQSQEGQQLGAVRVTYSLEALDDELHASLLNSAVIQVIIFVVGFGGIALIFRQVVARRLKRLADTMKEIEENTDLNRRLTIEGNDEVDEVSSALNRMVAKFHDSIQQVASTTHQINDSAERISSISDATLDMVHRQNTGTDSVAAAINEMEASSQQVKNNAEDNAKVSQSVVGKAEQSSSIANGAVEGIQALKEEITQTSSIISRLDDRTQEVGKVLGMISSIARETNLLALNAAVEAARAGESGKGFAVVATEVRSLATSTHQFTDEIRNAIEALENEVNLSVASMDKACISADGQAKQVQEVAHALQEIIQHIVEINQMNSQMAASADEQNLVARAINKDVLDIKGTATASEEDAQQGKQISGELVALSHSLNELVDRFKI